MSMAATPASPSRPGRPISANGKCPACQCYSAAEVPGVRDRVICLDCETVFIRLKGCEAFRHDAVHSKQTVTVTDPNA